MYVNVEIYNIEQHQLNVVYFNVDLNNVRQRRNNVVYFNVDFHNLEQRRNNVVNMTIWKKKKKKKLASSQKQSNSFVLQRVHWTQNLIHFILHFKKNICWSAKNFWNIEYTELQKRYLNHLTL